MNNNWQKDYPLQELHEAELHENSSLKKMLQLIAEGREVVDFGCATGYFAQLLNKKGCRVTGVEINAEAANVAGNYCEKVVVADLDFVNISEIFDGQTFDVAVFGDVLEHLRDPWKVLKETRKILKPEGCVVASIPNIAHGAIRLALLQGRFDYMDLGILDNTHLRFFNLKNVEELFERSGYFVDVIERTKLPVFSASTLVPSIERNAFDIQVIQQVEQAEEADTFQFIVRAFPLSEDGKYAALKQLYSQLVNELEQSQSQLQQKQVELEQSQSQLQQTQTVVEQSQCELQNTQTELEQFQCELQNIQTELERSQSQLQQTQAELEQSQCELQNIQTELERSQSQLQQTQAELEQSQCELQNTQTELERSQSQLQKTEAELERSQSQLQQTQLELKQSQFQMERSQSQLRQTQLELKRSQNQIAAMESSKFWKLRIAWFKFKQGIGLTDTKIAKALVAGVTIPQLDNFREISFKVIGQNSPNGVFDGINGSRTATVEVAKTNSITVSGWAILPDESRPADQVIITYGKDNIIVGVAPVNLDRPDVAQVLSNPAYKHSGWSIKLEPANLPTGKVNLKAWAYNSATKEAIQLNLPSSIARFQNLYSRLKYLYAVLKVKGKRYVLSKILQKIYYKLNNSQPLVEVLTATSPNEDLYSKWYSKNFPRKADLKKMAETVEIFQYKPVISAIMPVFNTPERYLREAIESVIHQVYPYWELCIADDASTKPHVKQVLEEYASKDFRIKVVYRRENGHISRASNSAIEIATGEFIALLDHDDTLTPDAFYEVALLLNRYPEADMIYSDEDKIDEDNQIRDPYFKPDWCPDSFLSRMYTCHLGIYRRSLINEIGGFRAGFEGSQDYDLVLRFTEKTDKIFHIPKILYHWRIHPASTASSLDSKTYAVDAAKKALAEALERRGEPGVVTPAPGPAGYYVIRYDIQQRDLVSVIIPTRNLGNLVDRCLTSIFEKTTYENYEVILIDNGSNEQETIDIINKWKTKEKNRFRCYGLDIPFNYAKINNFAVENSKGKYLLFLNNDTEILTPDWMEAMIEQAQRPSIGAVGALLLYPDDTIQHAGVVAGIGGIANHSHKHFMHGSPGYFNHINTVNNFSALTAACLMCRRDVFEEVGGFEEKLAVAFNDVDLCFKFIEKGYRNIYLPHVVLYHYESKSRGKDDTPEKLARFTKEIEYMQNKWKEIIEQDSCYSLNLTRQHEDYSIKSE